jgi:Ser/Thr protein kinase RdoA (MazF antagonist)
MVTKTQIERIAGRIDALARRFAPHRNVVILSNYGETAEQAEARHYALHPEDRRAHHVITVLWEA